MSQNFAVFVPEKCHLSQKNSLKIHEWPQKNMACMTLNFEHVTLTVTFGLLLKNFNIGHNFFILWDKAFIFGMCVPYDKAFPMVP